MPDHPRVLAIIPARYNSSRLPGKALADIAGKTMIQRVWERCIASGLEHVFIATDDKRIFDTAHAFGANVLMTSSTCRSGTERCAEAARAILKSSGKNRPDPTDQSVNQESFAADVVINVQGDEPFLHPAHLNLLASAFAEPEVQIATLAVPIANNEQLFNPNCPKVVCTKQGNALYFSRHPIPFQRERDVRHWAQSYAYLKHIGIYAYRPETLFCVSALPESEIERSESLEQLRWLDHGFSIRVIQVSEETMTVDTAADLEAASRFAAQNQL